MVRLCPPIKKFLLPYHYYFLKDSSEPFKKYPKKINRTLEHHERTSQREGIADATCYVRKSTHSNCWDSGDKGGVEASPPARGFTPAPRPNQLLGCYTFENSYTRSRTISRDQSAWLCHLALWTSPKPNVSPSILAPQFLITALPNPVRYRFFVGCCAERGIQQKTTRHSRAKRYEETN